MAEERTLGYALQLAQSARALFSAVLLYITAGTHFECQLVAAPHACHTYDGARVAWEVQTRRISDINGREIVVSYVYNWTASQL